MVDQHSLYSLKNKEWRGFSSFEAHGGQIIRREDATLDRYLH